MATLRVLPFYEVVMHVFYGVYSGNLEVSW